MADSPQFVLPFAQREYVDMKRACRILGVSWQTVVRLSQSGLLEMIDYRRASRKKVRYQSIVDFCDGLRRQWDIPDRRAKLVQPYRHRDEELLPFPLNTTMGTEEALAALGLTKNEVIRQLVREGAFEAYQLIEGSYWRISRPSFEQYLRDHYYQPRRRPELGPYRKLAIETEVI